MSNLLHFLLKYFSSIFIPKINTIITKVDISTNLHIKVKRRYKLNLKFNGKM